jgi:hypothetical protein
VLERQNFGRDLEVGVVVRDRHAVLSRVDRGHQIGDSYRSMMLSPSQGGLCVEGTLPVNVVGRQVLVRVATVRAHPLVLVRTAGLWNASASMVAQVATRPPVMCGSGRSATRASRIRAAALVSMRKRAITAPRQLAERVLHRLEATLAKPLHLPCPCGGARRMPQRGSDCV